VQFADVAKQLAENEKAIAEDLIKCQGAKQDIGGYYYPCPAKAQLLKSHCVECKFSEGIIQGLYGHTHGGYYYLYEHTHGGCYYLHGHTHGGCYYLCPVKAQLLKNNFSKAIVIW